MSYLLDKCLLSVWRKQALDPNVAAWIMAALSVERSALYCRLISQSPDRRFQGIPAVHDRKTTDSDATLRPFEHTLKDQGILSVNIRSGFTAPSLIND